MLIDHHKHLMFTLPVSMSKALVLLSDLSSDLKLELGVTLLNSHNPIIVLFIDYALHLLILSLKPVHLRKNIDGMLFHTYSK